MKKVVQLIVFTLIFCTISFSAQAQEGTALPPKTAAIQAYDNGTKAYLKENYAEAAQWFSIANQIVPSPSALIQTIRSYTQAGEKDKAAQLALELVARYSDVIVKGNPIKVPPATRVLTPCVVIEKTDAPVIDDLLDTIRIIIEVSSQQTKRMCGKGKVNFPDCRKYLNAWIDLKIAHEAALRAFKSKDKSRGVTEIKKIKNILSNFKMYLDVANLPANPF